MDGSSGDGMNREFELRTGGRLLARPIARIQSFAHEKAARIIGITSNMSGTGVSLLARELAQSFANLGLVVLSEWLDPRLRTRRDFETFAGIPLVTRIPQLKSLEGRT